MNKKVFFGLLVLLVVSVILVFFARSSPSVDAGYKHSIVTISGKPFDALVSDTEALREQGLSGRSGLKADQVMLFIFDKSDMLGFWMKDMKFPIDMLWLDNQYRVVSSEENVSPDTYPKVFFPSAPSRYVIELSAGIISTLPLGPGDRVEVSGGK